MRPRLLAALLLCGFALAAPAQAASGEAYEISVILSLSGNGAFLGQAQQRSLRLIEPLINGDGGIAARPLHFTYYDDESSPQLAVQLAAQILASHPAALLGSGLVATCSAIAPLMKDGPLTYCLSPGIHPADGSYVFTVPMATREGQKAFLRYFKGRGWTRLAFIASSDATGREAEADFDAVLDMAENQDVKLVAREHFNPGDLSAMAQMERVKAANPQVVLAWSTGAAVATLFKAIVQAGLDVPVATTNGNMTYQQMAQYADFLPKQLYLPSSLWPAGQQGISVDPAVDAAQRRFYAAFKAAGLSPDTGMILPWDPAMMIVDALRKLGPQANAAALRGYIAQLTEYGGIQGRYDFEKTPQRGLDVSSAVITNWNPAEQIWKIVSKPGGAPLLD